jgi:integrase
MIRAAIKAFGERKLLDEITTADVERFRDDILDRGASRATANRYRDTLSSLFSRACRLGLVERNPVKGASKFKEAGGRVLWLSPEEEAAVREALPPHLRPLFTVSIHTGLRWSEQLALEWKDADFLTGTLTVMRSKNGRSRQVPMNSLVRSWLRTLPPSASARRIRRSRSSRRWDGRTASSRSPSSEPPRCFVRQARTPAICQGILGI